MMNADRINAVADAIESHTIDLGFNMNYFRMGNNEYAMDSSEEWRKWDKSGHQCGTVACIAGWTAAVMSEPFCEFTDVGVWLGLAADKSDAEYSMSTGGLLDQLFFASNIGGGRRLSSITQEEAVATLRRLAETGEVTWDLGEGEPT